MGYLGHLIKLLRAIQILLLVCACLSLHARDHAHVYRFFYSSPKTFLVVIAQGGSAVLGRCRQTAADRHFTWALRREAYLSIRNCAGLKPGVFAARCGSAGGSQTDAVL